LPSSPGDNAVPEVTAPCRGPWRVRLRRAVAASAGSCPVSSQRQPVQDRPQRRRPPCRNFDRDARSKELALQIVRRSGQISALQREQLGDLAEFDRAEGWRGDGAVSMVAWVTGQCGAGTSTARQWVRSAANLESLPCLAEGVASGELSLDLVEPLAEVAAAETDAALREASVHWSVRQARELVAWHRAQSEEADEARAAEAVAAGVDMSGPAVREFQHRTLRFNDTRRTIWVAKDDYATAKSALVGWVSADKRDRARHTSGAVPPHSVHSPRGRTPPNLRTSFWQAC